jgi:mRNA interferase RelE/StbE
LAWRIEFHEDAKKELAKLDKPVAQRIVRFLRERASVLDDPRSLGAALKGSRLGGFWKYRVGDRRVICDVQDQVITVQALRVGHRGGVYE